MSGIEVIHLPTGIKARACMRSQYQSKKAAFRVLVARLYAYFDVQTVRFRAPLTVVRTYHEPDNRVTIHATGQQFSYKQTVGKKDIAPLIAATAGQ